MHLSFLFFFLKLNLHKHPHPQPLSPSPPPYLPSILILQHHLAINRLGVLLELIAYKRRVACINFITRINLVNEVLSKSLLVRECDIAANPSCLLNCLCWRHLLNVENNRTWNQRLLISQHYTLLRLQLSPSLFKICAEILISSNWQPYIICTYGRFYIIHCSDRKVMRRSGIGIYIKLVHPPLQETFDCFIFLLKFVFIFYLVK